MTEPLQANVEHVLLVNIAKDDVPSNLFDSTMELELISIQMNNEDLDDEAQEIYSGSESEFDDYETTKEGVQVEVEEQESSG